MADLHGTYSNGRELNTTTNCIEFGLNWRLAQPQLQELQQYEN